MKQKLFYLAAFVAVVVAFCSCSNVQRVIKSGDAELIYERGVLFYQAEKWQKALALLNHCEPYFKGTLREDTIAFYKARSHFKEGDYMTASEQLDDFRRSFGRSVFIEDAEAMFAVSLFNMCPEPERDQTNTARALVAISEFMSHYPDSEQKPLFDDMTKDLTWRLHEKSYINAYTYYKIERYSAAIIAFRNAIQKYPASHRREDLMYYVVKASYMYADNSVESKQQDRYMATLDAYYTFVMEYPESKYKKEVDQMADVAKRFIEKNKKEE
jgi:outer membrane protein assembly factor BamD